MTTPGTTARKRRSGASLYTTLARFVCLRKSCFRRVDGGGGRMTEEGFRPPPAGAKRDPGGGWRSREVNGWRGKRGTVGLIQSHRGGSQPPLAARSQRGGTRERREMGEMGEI